MDMDNSFSSYIEGIFSSYPDVFRRVNDIAKLIKAEIDDINWFIQQNTTEVCPFCEKRCCINRHGYYDRLDILYIRALGLRPPSYRKGLSDTEPCQFLTDSGCIRERSLRPFRCNWYFCETLLYHMERGPAKPYREFIKVFNKVLDLRIELLEEFEKKLDTIGITSI